MQEPQENAIQPLPFLSSCPLKLSSLWQPHEGFNIYSEPTQTGHEPAQREWLGTGREKQLGVCPSPLFPPLGSARVPGQVGAAARSAPHPLPPLKDSKPLRPALSAPQFPVQDTGEESRGWERPGWRDGAQGRLSHTWPQQCRARGDSPDPEVGLYTTAALLKPLGALSPLVAHSQVFKKQE